MIIGVCAGKGAPGVSTLSAALTLVLPGRRLLAECDPSGADAPFRLRAWSGSWLDPDRWLGSLAAAARLGGADPHEFAQDSILGVPVLPGGVPVDRFAPVRPLWPQVAAALAGAAGVVVADLGRMHPAHAALPVARAASVLLVLGRPDVAGLAHLREQCSAMLPVVGMGPDRSPAVMAVAAPAGPRGRGRRRGRDDMAQVLAAAGLPCPVVGMVPHDPSGAAGLWAGPLTRTLAGSPLLRAVREVAGEVLRLRPDVAAGLATPAEQGPPTAGGPPADDATAGGAPAGFSGARGVSL